MTANRCLTRPCRVCQLARRYRLTPREVQVIALLGLKNKAIATVMGCAPRTVAKHIEHISSKTGGENKLGIRLWAIAKGMVRL
jgi:DNA-binding NarL/FixJ family response regulator